MRKLNLVSLIAGTIALTVSQIPALADPIATPHVAGDFQGWDAGADAMNPAGSGIWTATFTGLDPNSRHEFKITDGTWDVSIPGPNSWFYADGNGNITISYDSNSYSDGWSPSTDRIGLDVDPGAWTAVGDWQSQVGGGDWDNGNPNTAMTPVGGGIYEFSTTLVPGDYKWKAVVSGTWDSISWDQRSVGTADWLFSTDAVNNFVTFRVNALTGVAQIIVPEPSTIALMGVGSLLLLGRARRRNG